MIITPKKIKRVRDKRIVTPTKLHRSSGLVFVFILQRRLHDFLHINGDFSLILIAVGLQMPFTAIPHMSEHLLFQ